MHSNLPDSQPGYLSQLKIDTNPLFSITVILTITALLAISIFRRSNASQIPTINSYRWDFLQRRALREYRDNAKGLIAAGAAKYRGPFKILTPNGPRIILPASATEWVKTSKDLDHKELVREIYFADYSGFEGNRAIIQPDHLFYAIVKNKLSQNPDTVPVMNRQLEQTLKESWTDSKEWHTLNWPKDTMALISRMSASIFLGPELASNAEWQELTISHTLNMFATVEALRRWPSMLRPFVHNFLPESRRLRAEVQLARQFTSEVLASRAAKPTHSSADDHAQTQVRTKHEDAMTWMAEEAVKKKPNDSQIDHAAAQLGLAIAALHTTSEAFRMALLEICNYDAKQNLLGPLREEAAHAIAEEDGLWTAEALSRMVLLDSVMKEAQRLRGSSAGTERLAVRDTAMPSLAADGTTVVTTIIPRGSKVAVDSSQMWSPKIHEHPEEFDGRRFLRMRMREEADGKSEGGRRIAPFTSSSQEHHVFGIGRSLCPGRFFAAWQVKLALAHVLLEYDVRIQGEAPKTIRRGFFAVTDQNVKVEVRKRHDSD